MDIRTVVIANKITLFERLTRNGPEARLKALFDARAPIVTKIEASHRDTVRTRERVRQELEHSGIRVVEHRRGGRVADGRYDAVIVVGGDGTVLDVARGVRATPIIAVNSSPVASVGHFCCATGDDFATVIERIRSGDLGPTRLARLRLAVDGVVHPYPALNDVLFAAVLPAETARYILRVGGREEEQKSSGIWVSTAAGSTGAVLSAGGVVMDIDEGGFQYVVREPFYRWDEDRRYRLVQGIEHTGTLSITSRMINGGVYLDGQRTAARVGYACRVDLSPDGPPLNIVLKARRP